MASRDRGRQTEGKRERAGGARRRQSAVHMKMNRHLLLCGVGFLSKLFVTALTTIWPQLIMDRTLMLLKV